MHWVGSFRVHLWPQYRMINFGVRYASRKWFRKVYLRRRFSSSSGPGCEFPFGFTTRWKRLAVASRFREKALTITRPMISRSAIPEAIRSGISQPGGARAGVAAEAAGIGVVTIAWPGGTSVPTAENVDEACPVAICVPLVTANTPVNWARNGFCRMASPAIVSPSSLLPESTRIGFSIL